MSAKKDIETCAKLLEEKFPASSLSEEEAYFFQPDLYTRFATEHDGDAAKASAALQACLDWRKSYQPHKIDPLTACAAALASQFINVGGLDKEGRPVVLLSLCHPTIKDVPQAERVRLFLWLVEELARREKEYFILISDFSLVGKEKDPQGAATRDETTQLLDKYYPARMVRSYMYNPPWFISSFAPLRMSFMSAKMKARVRTNCSTKDLLKDVSEDQLPVQCGGKYELGATVVESAPRLA